MRDFLLGWLLGWVIWLMAMYVVVAVIIILGKCLALLFGQSYPSWRRALTVAALWPFVLVYDALRD